MEWTNEKILEFLDLFETEPCLWDPRVLAYKNRTAHSEAWRRIAQSLSFRVKTEELKRKKESLMGYYRIHLNKYKKSIKSGISKNDVYTTNWFAFDVMDSFLRPIYGEKTEVSYIWFIKYYWQESQHVHEAGVLSVIKTMILWKTIDYESTSSNIQEDGNRNSIKIVYIPNEELNESSKEGFHNKLTERSTTTGDCSNNESEKLLTRNINRNRILKRPRDTYQIPETPLKVIKSIGDKNTDHLDEYDHFACMIASKIRRIPSMDDREILMNSIHNLTFEYYMKGKQKMSSDHSMIQPMIAPIYASQKFEEDLNSDSSVQS